MTGEALPDDEQPGAGADLVSGDARQPWLDLWLNRAITASTTTQLGFAEYFGGRYIISQRLLWDGYWKLVHNGFDYDELYNLADDPFEMNNLAQEPTCAEQLQAMTRQMWQIVVESGDHSLYNTHYPSMRIAAAGPG